MKTKINPTIKDYKKIASLAKKLDQIDKQSSKAEKEFIAIFNKFNNILIFIFSIFVCETNFLHN